MLHSLHFSDAATLSTPKRPTVESLVSSERELFILLRCAIHSEGCQQVLRSLFNIHFIQQRNEGVRLELSTSEKSIP